MVGVAGRSKACHTCKKRRIACSLERPHCAQCLKAGRLCAGYQRDRIFIVNGKISENLPASAADQDGLRREDQLCMTSPKNLALVSLDGSLANSGIPMPGAKADLLHISAVLPCAAYRQQLTSTFNDSYDPIAMLGPDQEKTSWFMLLTGVPVQSRALEKSTLAVCLAGLGRANKDPVLVRESLQLYTQGLQQLQILLRKPKCLYQDETLGACMALAMYELLECPANSKRAYFTHHEACTRLIQLRGPDAHTSGLGHQLFLVSRFQGILKALEDHRPTYLADTTWKTRPWKYLHKRPFDELLDIFVLAPAIFQQADKFDAMEPHHRLLAALRVAEDCWKIDEKLQAFRQNLENSVNGPLYWPQFSKCTSSANDPTLGRLFPIAFYFVDLRVARTMTLYWATLTMLWSGMTKLYHEFPALSQNESSSGTQLQPCDTGTSESRILPPLEHRTQFATMASNVCQSVEYCMQDSMLSLGPQSMIAPLKIVVETMREYPFYDREIAWAEKMLESITARGIRMLRYVDQK